MSHNSYTRPTWVSGTDLFAAEMADLDAKTFKAINGDDGGTWAPSSAITIGGAGLTARLVSSNYVDAGTLGIISGSILSVDSASYVSISGSTIFSNGSLTAIQSGAIWAFSGGSSVTFGSGSVCDSFGDTTFKTGSQTVFDSGSSLSFGGSSAFASTSNVGFNGTLSLAGTAMGVSKKITASSTGRIVKRVTSIATTGVDSSAYGPANADTVVVLALTNTVNFTINDTDASNGDEMTFVNKSTTNTLIVKDPSLGTGIASLQDGTSGFRPYVVVYREGGIWKLLHGPIAP